MASWLYVYCIIEGTDPPPGGHRGLGCTPPRAAAYRDISAIVSGVPERSIPVTTESALLHERLVEELMQDRAVLPVRFGTVLGDAKDVTLHLSERYGTYLKDLNLVKGKVEFGLRVFAPREAEMGADDRDASDGYGPGSLYLMTQWRRHAMSRSARQQLGASTHRIDDHLVGRAVDRRLSCDLSGKMVMSGAYLVWRDRVAAFKEGLEDQQKLFPELQFLLTGPWPAYSFVTPLEKEVGFVGAA